MPFRVLPPKIFMVGDCEKALEGIANDNNIARVDTVTSGLSLKLKSVFLLNDAKS